MDINKALFLDRDGVINVYKSYVYKIEDFEFMDGIFNLCRIFQNKGYLLFIITNQAGIGKGYYSEKELLILNEWMLDEFQSNGIIIKKVNFCPHHPQASIDSYKMDCKCRKPKPGMILKAKKEFNLDLKKSILIGDRPSDIQAGIAAGIEKNFWINTNAIKYKCSRGGKIVIVKSVDQIIRQCCKFEC